MYYNVCCNYDHKFELDSYGYKRHGVDIRVIKADSEFECEMIYRTLLEMESKIPTRGNVCISEIHAQTKNDVDQKIFEKIFMSNTQPNQKLDKVYIKEK